MISLTPRAAPPRISSALTKCIGRLEKVVQRDEGKRGIEKLCREGELLQTALSLLESRSVLLVTGFPCFPSLEPPTETDGPAGTLSIARALVRTGRNVVVATDECNGGVVRAAYDHVRNESDSALQPNFTLQLCPPTSKWSASDEAELQRVGATVDHVLALERVSPSASDGNAYTMRGIVMGEDLVSPLGKLFDPTYQKAQGFAYGTSGVGDGGNEVGMANVAERVREHVNNGELIVSALPADNLLVCSVSNWGGYAVAAAMEAIIHDNAVSEKTGETYEKRPFTTLLPTEKEELALADAVMKAGGRDGMSGAVASSVDGMPIESSIGVLNELKTIVSDFKADVPQPPSPSPKPNGCSVSHVYKFVDAEGQTKWGFKNAGGNLLNEAALSALLPKKGEMLPTIPESVVEDWMAAADKSVGALLATTTTESAAFGQFLPPLVCKPPAIIGIGLNYRKHAEETGFPLPKFPIYFMKNPSSVVATEDNIIIPEVCNNEVDYEVELAVVIGKDGKNIAVEDALEYVGGYTVGNDVSARKWQGKKGGGQWCRSKSYDTFCPVGPCLAMGIDDPNNLGMKLSINGEVMQNSATTDLIFNVQEIISFLSEGTTLEKGTIILTGTPEGVGFTRKPPRWLVENDMVEAYIENIGILVNQVK